MAKVRIGFSTQFELENELVGIGTDNPTNTLQALGNIRSSDAKAIGVSTFTTYQGFTDTKLSLEGSAGAKQGTTSGEIIIEGTVNVSSGTTYTSGPENLTVTDNFTIPGISDDKPTVGTTRFNENLGALEFYTGVEWRAVNSRVDMGNMGRGIVAGGFVQTTTPSSREIINYINIPSKGNSQYFGDLTESRARCSAVASPTRACIQMGQYTNKIDYITIQSTGNAVDFGDTGSAGAGYRSAASSSTRGLWAGGYTPGPTNNINNIDYIEISTLGNGIDFGDLRGPRWAAGNSGCSNSIRAVFSGGYEGPNAGPAIDGHPSRTIDFVNIASTGNAIDFGKLIANLSGRTGLSNSVRGIWAGGGNQAGKSASIGYITIASSGNAEYFGDLSLAREMPTASSTQIRGTFAGGRTPSFVQVIDYVTIATTGNSVNFGQLTDQWFNGAGCSDSHGGLGGF